MKKLLLIILAIATLTSIGYSQTTPTIKHGGIVVYENNGHGLVAATKDLGAMDWDYAKKSCYELTLNGYDDWYLPTQDDLIALYKNLQEKGVGGFKTNFYWSSAEESDNSAWVKNFYPGFGGVQYAKPKSGIYTVRAVRRF